MESCAEKFQALWPSGVALPPGFANVISIVEQYLGSRWIDSRLDEARQRRGRLAPLLRVVDLAEKIPFVSTLQHHKCLRRKLRRDDSSAYAEITAVYALGRPPAAVIELYPSVLVGRDEMKPDFKVRRDADAWTYVEVTRPDNPRVATEAVRNLEAIAQRLLEHSSSPFSLDVDLRRLLTPTEIDELSAKAESLIVLAGSRHEDMGALGDLFLNYEGAFERPAGPRAAVGYELKGSNPMRRVALRMILKNAHVDRFVNREMKQLPTNSPTLVILDVSNTTSALAVWPELLTRYFAKRQAETPSAVALIVPLITTEQDSTTVLHHTFVALNPNARISLPPWIAAQLDSMGGPARRLLRGRVRFWE